VCSALATQTPLVGVAGMGLHRFMQLDQREQLSTVLKWSFSAWRGEACSGSKGAWLMQRLLSSVSAT
jgi:hypothetical protein